MRKYLTIIVEPQDCMLIFDSDGRYMKNMKSCDESCDSGPINKPIPTQPPTTQPGITIAHFYRSQSL